MIKIIHIITGLNLGGAEKMLYKLLQETNRDKYNIEIISLTDKGYYGPKIEQLGIKVHEINMGRIPTPKTIIKIRSKIKAADIVQTWMYHADLLGYLATRFMKKKKLLWGIRRTNLNKEENKRSTLLIAKVNSFFSKKVNTIISCSIAGKKSHINYGYSEDNMIIIPNGFEMDKLYFNLNARLKIREKLMLNSKKIILNVGRWNIAKDQKNLIQAYKIIEDSTTHLIMIGPNITYQNQELLKLIKESGIENYTLLGPQPNINDFLSAADVYVSSSKSEGFPNVIGEAMACELPCVVTDAGDSSFIAGKTGIVVPIENSKELAFGLKGMLNLSDEEKSMVGKKARKRIEENFEIKTVVKMFEAQYQ